jgi:plastocyanin
MLGITSVLEVMHPRALTLADRTLADPASAAGGANSIKIEVKNFMFGPQTLTVSAGSTVIWTNLDQEPHTIASDAGLFRSNAIDTNETFSFRFDKPGTYRYLCTLHPQMLGVVVVV